MPSKIARPVGVWPQSPHSMSSARRARGCIDHTSSSSSLPVDPPPSHWAASTSARLVVGCNGFCQQRAGLFRRRDADDAIALRVPLEKCVLHLTQSGTVVMHGKDDGEPHRRKVPRRIHHPPPEICRLSESAPPAGCEARSQVSYSIRSPLTAREMTSCWICSVPSKMSGISNRPDGLRMAEQTCVPGWPWPGYPRRMALGIVSWAGHLPRRRLDPACLAIAVAERSIQRSSRLG